MVLCHRKDNVFIGQTESLSSIFCLIEIKNVNLQRITYYISIYHDT